MSDTWFSYSRDPRVPCRYGTNCYSKNIEHQRKFKHPPNNLKRKNCDAHDDGKRPKPDNLYRKPIASDEPNAHNGSFKDGNMSQKVPNSDKTVQDGNADNRPSKSPDPQHSFMSDPRKPCRYGNQCFTKNVTHQKQFKHPPKKTKQKTLNDNDVKKKSEIKNKNLITTEIMDRSGREAQTLIKEVPKTNLQDSETTIQKPEVVSESLDQTVDNSENCPIHDASADNHLLKELFLLDMPPDFYKFFECLRTEENISKTLSGVNLQLIGPFELLLGKLPKVKNKELYLVHWRFFYDPPEFQVSYQNMNID